MRKHKIRAGVNILTYCLMPNHVHMTVVPERENSLAKFLGPVHCQYATKINAAHGWQGHLWQQRFYSTVMDEQHTLVAMRYVELNPVRAELCARPDEWRWSSVCANLGLDRDELVDTDMTRSLVDNWSEYLNEAIPDEIVSSVRKNTRTGRPAGSRQFVHSLDTRSVEY
jgi:putative transposase